VVGVGMKLPLLLVAAAALLSASGHASRVVALRRAVLGQVGSGTLLATAPATAGGSTSFAIPPGGPPADKSAMPNMPSPPSTGNSDAMGAAQAMLAGQAAAHVAKKIDVVNAKREQQLNSAFSSVSSVTSHSHSSMKPNSISSSSAMPSLSFPSLDSWSMSLLGSRQCDKNPKTCLYKVKEVPHLNEELKELLHKQEKEDEKIEKEEVFEGEEPDLPNSHHDQHSRSQSRSSPTSRGRSSSSHSTSSGRMRFSEAQVNPAHLQAIAKANEKEEYGFIDPISRGKQLEQEKWENRKEAERVSLRTHFQLVAEREGSSLLSEEFDRSHGLAPTMSISTNLIRQATELLPTADIRHERFQEDHDKNCMGRICPRDRQQSPTL